NGARELPSKYPFFLYSTKFLPYHLAKALDLGRGSWANPYVAQFAGTRHACLLVEYGTFIVQNGLQDGEIGELLYWFELLDADIDLPTSPFIHAYQSELEHRRRQFGFADSRYESWRALSLLFPVDLLQKRDLQPLAGLSRSGKLVSGIRETPFRALPDYLAQPPNLGIQKVSQKVQAVSIALGGFRERATDLMALSMDSLPVPMIFLGEALAASRDDWPMAQRLATVSLRKSRGKRNLFEAASLLDIAVAMYLQDGKNWGDVEDILWQALGILDQLPPQPQIQFYKLRALVLKHSLIDQGKEVAKETACRLRDFIGKERKKTGNRMWEYFLCNTANGMQLRINCLCQIACHYLDRGNYAEAASWAGEAVALGEGKHYAEVGDLAAAEVVLSDAASRYLADFYSPFSTGLTLASTVFLYRRRFPQRRVLLLSANEAWKNSAYPNLYNTLSRESSFAMRFTKDAELLRELSAASDLQASFVHQAYEHLTRARDANDELGEGDPDDLDKDATEEQEDRQKTIVDLEDRLKLLGSGPLPPKVTDGNQDVAKGNRNLRRVKSLLLPGTPRPLQRRLSLELY
ncbi:hypothetical protein CDV31_015556, partial [Fusarium ambrosium]